MADTERTIVWAYVVTSRPSDFGGANYVVRKWLVGRDGLTPQPFACLCRSLQEARAGLKGLTRLSPEPGDDPVIVETWV